MGVCIKLIYKIGVVYFTELDLEWPLKYATYFELAFKRT